MSRSTDVALALALAIASLGGVLLFPRALEPGRSEENGIALNLLVDRGDGAKANDWYTGTATLRSRLSGGSLRLESHDSGLQIFSRPLALFAGECYAVVVHGREIAGTSQLVVSDEEVANVAPVRTASAPVPLSEPENDSVPALTVVGPL